MNRRDFLKTTGLIVAAPAIVRAESLMKIWVPPEPKILIPRPPGYYYVKTGGTAIGPEKLTLEEQMKYEIGSRQRPFSDVNDAFAVASKGETVCVSESVINSPVPSFGGNMIIVNCEITAPADNHAFSGNEPFIVTSKLK